MQIAASFVMEKRKNRGRRSGDQAKVRRESTARIRPAITGKFIGNRSVRLLSIPLNVVILEALEEKNGIL